jgi:hypothetical protein
MLLDNKTLIMIAALVFAAVFIALRLSSAADRKEMAKIMGGAQLPAAA